MAVILAGGMGARLEPYTISMPKPLVPLGDIPIVEIVVRQLKAAGVTRIVLALGHMAHSFKPFAERWERFGINIEYVLEDQPLGTAGSIALVDRLEDNFLVMNGDLLTTLDYRALFDLHTSNGAWGTIAVARREQTVDYGVIGMTAKGELAEYVEKPVIRYNVSMGIYALSRRCLEFIPPSSRFDMPDLMRAMLDAGNLVMCHPTSCYWQDIGRLSDLRQATADYIAEPRRFLPTETAP